MRREDRCPISGQIRLRDDGLRVAWPKTNFSRDTVKYIRARGQARFSHPIAADKMLWLGHESEPLPLGRQPTLQPSSLRLCFGIYDTKCDGATEESPVKLIKAGFEASFRANPPLD